MKERLVIVGGGMAATRVVEEVSLRAPERFDITLIGEETWLPYNRVLLSSLLARDVDETDLVLKPRSWWDERNVRLVGGARAISIDTGQRHVHIQSGHAVPYDALVLATGSEPVQLPLPGVDLSGVLTFRTHDDVARMLAGAGGRKQRAIVIGGGLLGLEAAYGLRLAGLDVTVVHLMDRLMERQVDGCGGAMLKAALEALGINVLLKAESAGIQGSKSVEGLRLVDGRVLPADLVVMAVGIRPRAELAREAGLSVERGICVDDQLRTSGEDIYALGECAQHRAVCYGLVEPAYEQARTLAAHLCGVPAAYEGSLLATNLKVSGVDVFSAGDFVGDSSTETISFTDAEQGVYRKLVLKDGRLAGAVLVGDSSDALWYQELISSGAAISAIRSSLVLGRAFCNEGELTRHSEGAVAA